MIVILQVFVIQKALNNCNYRYSRLFLFFRAFIFQGRTPGDVPKLSYVERVNFLEKHSLLSRRFELIVL